MLHQNRIHQGKLLEISPFGTGFIQDSDLGVCYGFHTSMLLESAGPDNPSRLEGQTVQFRLGPAGFVEGVSLYTS